MDPNDAFGARPLQGPRAKRAIVSVETCDSWCPIRACTRTARVVSSGEGAVSEKLAADDG